MTRTIGAAIGVVLVLLFFASLGASYGHARNRGRSEAPSPHGGNRIRSVPRLLLSRQIELVEGNVPVRFENLESPLFFLLELRLIRIEAFDDLVVA